jgi:hypothetical protein
MNSSNAHHTSEAPSRGPALAVVDDLDDLVHLVEVTPDLYVRWSRGPDFDLETTSVDHLTGVELPGLSANPLAVEPWWGDRPARIWVEQPGVAPWLLVGEEVARGPDNEPVVRCHRPVARLGAGVIGEAERSVEQFSGSWGPLDRATSPRAADAAQ